jgi:hypothetical protein
LDEQHQARLKEILEIQLSDNVKGWQIHADGSSTRIASPDAHSSRSQEQIYEVMRQDYGDPRPAQRSDSAEVSRGRSIRSKDSNHFEQLERFEPRLCGG